MTRIRIAGLSFLLLVCAVGINRGSQEYFFPIWVPYLGNPPLSESTIGAFIEEDYSTDESVQSEWIRLADRVVRRFVEQHQRARGDYTMDLGLEGIAVLYEITMDDRYAAYILDVADHRGWSPGREIPYGSPPFTGLLFDVYRLRRDEGYVAPFVRQSDLYRREVPRSATGMILQERGEALGGGYAVLIDRLQEYASRMARAGALSGDDSFFRESVEQYRLHRDVLRDPTTGLWSQGRGWLEDVDELSPGAWSRGHGWLIRGMVESMLYLPRDGPEYRAMQQMLEETVNALLEVRDSDGMWHALLHLPHDRSPPESSGTGLIAYYIARSVVEGFLPVDPYRSAALKSMDSLRHYVDAEGVVQSVSPGPGPTVSIERYLDTTFPDGNAHGAAALIYAFAGASMLDSMTAQN